VIEEFSCEIIVIERFFCGRKKRVEVVKEKSGFPTDFNSTEVAEKSFSPIKTSTPSAKIFIRSLSFFFRESLYFCISIHKIPFVPNAKHTHVEGNNKKLSIVRYAKMHSSAIYFFLNASLMDLTISVTHHSGFNIFSFAKRLRLRDCASMKR
jgi:hypothetical protein